MLRFNRRPVAALGQASPEGFVVRILQHLLDEMPDELRGIPLTLQYGQIEAGIERARRIRSSMTHGHGCRPTRADDTAEYLGRVEEDTATALRNAEKELGVLTKRKEWEAGKTVADLAGIVDPTPTSDLISMGMSAAEGDWVGMILSGPSVAPYLGDVAAKAGARHRATRRTGRRSRVDRWHRHRPALQR